MKLKKGTRFTFTCTGVVQHDADDNDTHIAVHFDDVPQHSMYFTNTIHKDTFIKRMTIEKPKVGSWGTYNLYGGVPSNIVRKVTSVTPTHVWFDNERACIELEEFIPVEVSFGL